MPLSSCGAADDFDLHRAQGQHGAPESLVHGANGTRGKAYGDERSAQRKVVVRSVPLPFLHASNTLDGAGIRGVLCVRVCYTFPGRVVGHLGAPSQNEDRLANTYSSQFKNNYFT